MLSESCDVPQKEAMTLHNLCAKDMAQWCQLTLPADGFTTSHKHVSITANNLLRSDAFNLLHPSVISNFLSSQFKHFNCPDTQNSSNFRHQNL